MFPSQQEFERLLNVFERVPVYLEVVGDLDTPVSILHSLLDNENVILLESANQNKVYSRFSFLAFNARKFILTENGLHEETNKGLLSNDENNSVFDFINRKVKDNSNLSAFFDNYGNFCGGFIALLPFEFVHTCNTLRYPLKKLPKTLGVFYFVETFLVYDNYTNKLYIAKSAKKGDSYAKIEEQLAYLHSKICHNHLLNTTQQKPQIIRKIPKAKFLEKVEYLKSQIENGEAIQVVLSDYIQSIGINPFEFYRNLRRQNPSPYMFFIKDKKFYVVGSSPEVHLSVRKYQAMLKPIAGTRPIGQDEAQTKLFELELSQDSKENAEHLMLVDLARNDLSRICKPNSVDVVQFKHIERYSSVMHLVSQVEGELKDDVSLMDALNNTFPAGTVSGAPKVRAIELIDETEETLREFYAGCVGYIGFNGNMDMAITIRTAFFDDDTVKFQAGAGIVYDSNPLNEYKEVLAKLGALLKAGGIYDSFD